VSFQIIRVLDVMPENFRGASIDDLIVEPWIQKNSLKGSLQWRKNQAGKLKLEKQFRPPLYSTEQQVSACGPPVARDAVDCTTRGSYGLTDVSVKMIFTYALLLPSPKPVHQNRCLLGLFPRHHWGAYSAPQPLAGFKGATSLQERDERIGKD